MSRFWNSEDEIYIYTENLRLKSNRVESIINRINAKTKYDLHIINIMDIYKDKLNSVIETLNKNNVNYFSPSYNNKSKIYSILDEYIEEAINELIEIHNKLVNPKYGVIVDTKLILLLVRKNINKYNYLIDKFRKLEVKI